MRSHNHHLSTCAFVTLTLIWATLPQPANAEPQCAMVPAFEHLLRNCVAHGIEASAVRETAGKPATGAIAITVGYEGNDVSVEFRDDGAGLDLERIRERALTQGLIGPEDAVDASRAAELIYLPGFSTATELTGLSGRGVPTGTMLGGILSDWALGVAEQDLDLRVEPLRPAPLWMAAAPALKLRQMRLTDNLATQRDRAPLPPHA